MPSNTLTLVAQLDTRQANSAIKGLNSGLGSIEDAALKGAKGASSAIQGFEQVTVRATANIGRQFAGLGGILAGLGIGTIAKAGFDIAASFETSQIALKAFLGDAEKATKLFDEIQTFAAKSPFEFKDLLTGATRLLAFGFEGEKVLPILKAVSAQSSAMFGSDAGKFDDFLRALGDVRAAGRLTGEELRQLKNVGVSIDDLGKGFGVSAAEFKDAVSKGIVPAGAAIDVIISAATKKFGPLREEIEKTAGTAVSNLSDAFGRLAKNVINLPPITKALNDFIAMLDQLGEAAKKNPALVENITKAIGALAAAFVAAKVITLINDLRVAFIGLNAVMLLNPWVLAAAGLVALGGAAYVGYQKLKEFEGEYARVSENIQTKKLIGDEGVKGLEKLGTSMEKVRSDFGLSADAIKLVQDASGFLPKFVVTVKDAAAGVASFSANAAEAAKKVAAAEKSAADELDRAKKAEFTGLAQILEQHRQYQAELGLSKKANQDLATAVLIRIRTEAAKELKSNAAEVVKNLEDEKKARLDFATAQFKESQDFQAQTLAMAYKNTEDKLSSDRTAAEASRDYQLRALEAVGARTVEDKIAVEQQRLAIETASIQQLEKLDIEALNRRRDREVQEWERVKANFPERIAEVDARIKALTEQINVDAAAIANKASVDIQAAQQAAGINSAQIVRDNTLRIFDQIKQGSGEVFDAMLTKGESVFGALGNVLKNALLTALREIVTSQVARTLTQLVSGQGVGLSSGGGAGKLGGLLGTLGIGAAPIFGAGAPGGTSGFAGPVGALSTAAGAGGLGGGGALGGGIGGGAGIAGLAGSAGLLGIGGAALGLKGAFSAGQSSNKFLKGAAPAIGATAGLFGFGALSFLFPSLVAAGPAGWLGAAGIGATIGLIGIFKKKAEDKIVEKVKKIYGIDIDRGFAKDPLLGIIKQNFGGNLDVGLQSPIVRDLIELYAMSFGKSPSGGFTKQMTPLSFSQSGGALTQMPSYQNGTRLPSIMPSGNAQPVVIQQVFPAGAVADFFEGKTIQTLATPQGTRAVAISQAQAMTRNIGRRDQQASILAPNLIPA